MTAGLPGTGIGGIFYLLSALLMPVHEFFALLSGRRNLKRWRTALKQAAIASIILIGMWLTGWFLGYLLHLAGTNNTIVSSGKTSNLIRAVTVSLSLVTLAAVLIGVQALSIFVRYEDIRKR